MNNVRNSRSHRLARRDEAIQRQLMAKEQQQSQQHNPQHQKERLVTNSQEIIPTSKSIAGSQTSSVNVPPHFREGERNGVGQKHHRPSPPSNRRYQPVAVATPRFSRDMELRAGMEPSARVVRVNRPPPKVTSASKARASNFSASEVPVSKPLDLNVEDDQHPPSFEAKGRNMLDDAYDGSIHCSLPSSTVPSVLPPVLLSESIVERGIFHRSTQTTTESGQSEKEDAERLSNRFSGGGKNQRQSRFKQNVRCGQSSTSIALSSYSPSSADKVTKGGFPSLEVPLGTLARRGRPLQLQQNQVPETRDGRKIAKLPSSASDVQNLTAGNGVSWGGKRGTDSNGARELDETPSSTADSILAGMSNDDIANGISEITTTLSPDMVSFLRARGRLKARQQKQQQQQQAKPNNQKQTQQQSEKQEGGEKNLVHGNECEKQDVERKENGNNDSEHRRRVVDKALSSVRTGRDIDRVFASLQPRSEKLKLQSIIAQTGMESEDACTVVDCSKSIGGRTADEVRLEGGGIMQGSSISHANTGSRSSSPRKEVYGGKTSPTREHWFMEDLEESTALLRSSAPRQRFLGAKSVRRILEWEKEQRDRTGRGGLFSKATKEPLLSWPTYLPVSLRCLLDLPHPRRHRLLHCHVLRSIYLLLSFFANPDHAISVEFFSNNHSRDIIRIYQDWFVDDAVPTPSLLDAYAPGVLSAAPVREDIENKGAAGMASACYVTDSSAESAKADGDAFYRDPMWTLLSRMRVLPCLAQLLVGEENYPFEDSHTFTDKVTSNIREEWNERLTRRMPDEGLATILGIFAFLAVRSPGAATAITDHPSILPSVISLSLTPGLDDKEGEEKEEYDGVTDSKNDGLGTETTFVVNTRIALPALLLLGALARQSRHAASSIHVTAALPGVLAILGMKAESDEEWQVQKVALVLWRTLLRYGVALPRLSAFLSLGASSLAVQDQSKFSLTADYLTSFAVVCDCARVANYSGAMTTTNSADEPIVEVSTAQSRALEMAGVWLAPHVRLCAHFLRQQGEAEESSLTLFTSAEGMKLAASRLSFIASFVSAAGTAFSLGVNEEKTEVERDSGEGGALAFPPEESMKALHTVLLNGTIELAVRNVVKGVLDMDHERAGHDFLADNVVIEAASSALVKATLSLLESITNFIQRNISYNEDQDSNELVELDMIRYQFEHVVGRTVRSIVDSAALLYSQGSKLSHSMGRVKTNVEQQRHMARVGWLNGACFAMVKLLSPSNNNNSPVSESDNPREESVAPSYVRQFAFSLLGRLQRGEEYMAAVLLGMNSLFERKILQPEGESSDLSSSVSVVSPIQSVLLRELGRTILSRKQLEHSCQLRAGRDDGPVVIGKGSFGLESLRSEADYVQKPKPAIGKSNETMEKEDVESSPTSQFLLPLGKLWLWHLLSGTVSPIINQQLSIPEDQRKVGMMVKEVAEVVGDCMEILVELENESPYSTAGNAASSSSMLYASCIRNGMKLYHLFNVCLFPEEVIRDERVRHYFLHLFRLYTSSSSSSSSLVVAFTRACCQHSRTSDRAKKIQNRGAATADESKLMSLLEREVGTSGTTERRALNENDMRALQSFVNDLCQAFLEFGAQYDEFVHCIRFLLRPEFPPSHTSGVLTELRDVLHLLTTTEEDGENYSRRDATNFLDETLRGGLPSQDRSKRDPPEVLDALVTVLKGLEQKQNRQNSHGFCYMWGVACLGRNLAINVEKMVLRPCSDGGGSGGLETSRMRLKRLQADTTVAHVIIVAVRLLKCTGVADKHALMDIVLDVCLNGAFTSKEYYEEKMLRRFDLGKSEEWNDILKVFRQECKIPV